MMQALANLIHSKSEEKLITPKLPQIPITKIDPNKKQIKTDSAKFNP